MTLAEAYRQCEEITRAEARNFYYGIRLLPADRRAALCAVYALARRIDDIADGQLGREAKLEALARIRSDLDALPGANDGDPVVAAVSDAVERYPIPLGSFGDLVDGAEMDVVGTRYERFADLLVYSRRVAGSIGRLSLGVFETDRRAEAGELADDLRVAFQLTNILRDVREDVARGRVYIPEEDLERFGCELHDEGASGPVDELVLFETARAREWFERGLELLPLVDRRSAVCVAAMAGIYQRLLARIEREPGLVLRERLSLPGWEKGWVAVRSLAGVAP